MVNILTNGAGHVSYRVQEFVMDVEDDLKDLPRNVSAGSTAICIATGAVYMLNSSGEWVAI